MSPVPPLRILAVQTGDGLRQVALRWLHRRVIVIRHQAVVPAFELEVLNHIAEDIDELPIVGGVEEDGHPAIATRHHVSNEAWSLIPGSTRHGTCRFTTRAASGRQTLGRKRAPRWRWSQILRCCWLAMDRRICGVKTSSVV